jgi:hypothetical protein
MAAHIDHRHQLILPGHLVCRRYHNSLLIYSVYSLLRLPEQHGNALDDCHRHLIGPLLLYGGYGDRWHYFNTGRQGSCIYQEDVLALYTQVLNITYERGILCSHDVYLLYTEARTGESKVDSNCTYGQHDQQC